MYSYLLIILSMNKLQKKKKSTLQNICAIKTILCDSDGNNREKILEILNNV